MNLKVILEGIRLRLLTRNKRVVTSLLIAWENGHDFFLFDGFGFQDGDSISDVHTSKIGGRWDDHVDVL